MQTNHKAFLKYLCALLIFASNGIMALQISGLTSYEIVFLKTLIGSAFIILIYLLTGGKFHIREHRRDALFIAISGLMQAASWVCLYEGYRCIGVSLSTLIYYCGPVLLVASAPVLFNEKLNKAKAICFAVVLVGLALINGTVIGTGKGNVWGFTASVLAAITFFLMLAFNKKSRNIHGMENAVIQITCSFLAMAIFIGITQQFVMHPAAGDWKWVIIQGVFNTAIGCYLYYSSFSGLSVHTIAVCGYIEPFAAVVFAAIFLHEAMTPGQYFGGLCIIGGAVLAEALGTATKKKDNGLADKAEAYNQLNELRKRLDIGATGRFIHNKRHKRIQEQ